MTQKVLAVGVSCALMSGCTEIIGFNTEEKMLAKKKKKKAPEEVRALREWGFL